MRLHDFNTSVNRRTALVGLGKASLLGLAGFPACGSDSSGALISPADADDTPAAVDCVLTPFQAEGPFYVRSSMVRSDITEGKEGIALGIDLTIVDATECTRLSGAAVDIWHTDASGIYSGYASQGDGFDEDVRGETFMRGVQVSDEQGQVHFESIYPGWYPGRVPHVHIKVFFENQTSITSQLYFPDDVSRTVYGLAPYSEREGFVSTESSDPVLRGDSPGPLRMTLAGDQNGFTASHTIGVAV